MSGNYKDSGHRLYILSDDTEVVLYVGISRRSIYNRWFGNGYSHMVKNAGGFWSGWSEVGQVVVDLMPKSLAFRMMLLTEEDCMLQLLGMGEDLGPRFDLADLEEALIYHLSPVLNAIGAKKSRENAMKWYLSQGAANTGVLLA